MPGVRIPRNKRAYEARRLAGLTLHDLARRVGVSTMTVWAAEVEDRHVSLELRQRIATELGSEASVLWPEDGDQ